MARQEHDSEGRSEADRRRVMDSLVEGRKLEAYAEHRTKEMHACWLCGAISYRRRPGKMVGQRFICVNCLRSLKETLDTLDQWEEELVLESELRKKVDEGLD
ncbi:MAG TPA: hypothetical protein VI893_09365 [Thermoplasmata archaeon]|nr:hypothetical protein [Thermoplasmata archaeon]